MTLSAEELAAMRDALDDLLPDTCHLLTATRTPDGQGGVTAEWGTVNANVSCRMDMRQGREVVAGGALQQYVSYMLTLPYDTTVTQSYRVEHNSVTYAVKSVNTNQSWIGIKRAELERV